MGDPIELRLKKQVINLYTILLEKNDCSEDMLDIASNLLVYLAAQTLKKFDDISVLCTEVQMATEKSWKKMNGKKMEKT